MARKRIEVTLTPDEHASLSAYVAHGHKSAREINRARILLLAHDGHTDADIANVLGVSHVTIYNMRKKYHHKGDQHILDVLHDEPRGGRPLKFDSTVEAKVTMIACSEPPPGAARWTLHLIADRLVKLDVVDTISYESVRTILKKQIETLVSGTMVHWANYGELSVAYGRCALAVCLTV
jgi:transposase